MFITDDNVIFTNRGFRKGLSLHPSKCGLSYESLAALSLCVWMLILLLPWWNVGDYSDSLKAEELSSNLPFQFAGFLVAVCGMLCGGFKAISRSVIFFVATWRGISLTIFFLYSISTSAISIAPVRSLIYSVGTLGVLFVTRAIWEGAGYQRVRQYLPAAGVMILGFLLLLYIRHGMGHRTIGGIRANQIGKTALAALVCFHFLNNKSKWIGGTAAILTIVAVSSRGSLVAAAMFLGFQLLTGRRPAVTILFTLAAIALMFAWEISAHHTSLQSPSDIIQGVLKIDDPKRGVDSGFTGRSEYWQRGLGYIGERPLIGYGFRTRKQHDSEDPYASAHSGFLNLTIDVGLIGTFFLLSIFLVDVYMRLNVLSRTVLLSRIMPLNVAETRRVNQIVCGVYLFTAILWTLEPSYLNIGIPHQVLFFVLLCAPSLVGDDLNSVPQGFPA